MAIHVRHRREILRRIRNRLIALALAVSLGVVFFGGVTLYLIVELRRATLASFDSIVYVSDEAAALPSRKMPSQSSASAKRSGVSPEVAPSIIVAPAVDAVAVAEISPLEGDDISDDAFGEGGGLAGGFSLGLGDGLGRGGNGRGIGGGGNGTGGGGKHRGVGLNDDIQIVLALDASGSMDYLFKAVSASMERMVSTLCRSKVNGRRAHVNVAVLAYGSARDGGAPWKVMDFTTEVDSLRKEVAQVSCDGGYERCGEAIAFADDNFAWNRRANNKALKVLIVAGNEPFDQGDTDFREAIVELRRSDIILNTIYCGRPFNDAEGWEEAAVLGGGVYTLQEELQNSGDEEKTLEEYSNIVRKLVQLPVMPLGSPTEQQAHLQERAELLKTLPKKNEALQDWAAEEGHAELKGYAWDAVELARRLGEDLTLERLGGRGNLPAELRGLPEETVLERLHDAAQERERLLVMLTGESSNSQDLCSRILRVIREQARTRGIDVKL